MDYRVGILGKGGREHALAYYLAKDVELFCLPGNAGTAQIATNVPVDITENKEIIAAVKDYDINFVVVGPELPLVNNIVGELRSNEVLAFGPDSGGAQLEANKDFARKFNKQVGVRQPIYYTCADKEMTIWAKENIGLPVVVKAIGLCEGKGVFICDSEEEFQQALKIMFDEQRFGSACRQVLVEEKLNGFELSYMAVCDGENFFLLPPSQDHKNISEGDAGPNTGGMGAYAPVPQATPAITRQVRRNIIKPILKAMAQLGRHYHGVLYVGVMVVDGMPYVLEYNVRFGDPETQVQLPLIESSLFRLLFNAACGKLKHTKVVVSDEYAVGVVLASAGYPGKPETGKIISGLDKINHGLVFHAGTKAVDGNIMTDGGRVLTVVGQNKCLADAIKMTYDLERQIVFEGKYCRRDIAQKGIKFLAQQEREFYRG